jgi:hypothetical protein
MIAIYPPLLRSKLMSEWMVRLIGPERDLRLLAESLQDADCRVIAEADGSYLRTCDFRSLAEVGAIKRIAEEIISRANRAAVLRYGDFCHVKTGAVLCVQADGSRSVTIFPPTALSWMEAYAPQAVGACAAKPKPNLRRDMDVLQQEPALDEALGYLESEPNEYGYYKAFEAIRNAAGGEHKLWKRGWATREEVESLRDSPQPKRHHDPRGMPKNPITLPTMRAVLLRVARRLAEWVSAGRP